MVAPKKSRRAGVTLIPGSHEGVRGIGPGRKEGAQALRREMGLITKGDDGAAELSRKLIERIESGAKRGRNPFGPSRVFGDQDGVATQERSDLVGLGANHHDDGPNARRSQRGLQGPFEQ